MSNPSAPEVEAIPPGDVSFKPLLPPPTLTRWQKFNYFMRTPEGGLLPLGIMVLGAHLFVFHYIFMTDDFLDDFEDEADSNLLVKNLVGANKNIRYGFQRIRETFTGYKD